MGVELLIPILGAVAGAVVSKAIAPKPPKIETPPQLPTPAAVPDAPKSQAAAMAAPKQPQGIGIGNPQDPSSQGAASTLLTGIGGVDPNSLNLGKNTLLGA